ncbi:hypothetical protein B0H19DRAFT_1224732 [Mycena capillaripes]|nr:hypothetical protein B0H19DRAFT_1224732 [Mycena capillaripes]
MGDVVKKILDGGFWGPKSEMAEHAEWESSAIFVSRWCSELGDIARPRNDRKNPYNGGQIQKNQLPQSLKLDGPREGKTTELTSGFHISAQKRWQNRQGCHSFDRHVRGKRLKQNEDRVKRQARVHDATPAGRYSGTRISTWQGRFLQRWSSGTGAYELGDHRKFRRFLRA